jgi:hypothetical protein
MPKNFRRVPDEVRKRLETFALDDVIVACAKQLRLQDVERYAHLGLRLENGKLVVPPGFVPDVRAGEYSRINVEGKEIIRKDLPKIAKGFSFYAPDWGDWSKGSHLVTHTRDVYQRDFLAPKEVELVITLLEQRGEAFLVRFAVDQVINRRSADFEEELLYNLNILQENIGSVDVFPSEATIAEYVATIRVDWELLPVGQLGPHEAVARLLRGKPISIKQKEIMERRLGVFAKLKPTHFISGTSGFIRYFGAMYDDNFVVFENIRYGNAIYVMFERWQELSQRSRIDLLRGDREGFERIEHREGWEDRLKAMLERHRQKRRRY